MFRIGEILCAETAANVGRDESAQRRVDAERAGGHIAVAVDVLAGEMQRVAAGVLANGAARFHRVGNDTVVVQLDRYDCGAVLRASATSAVWPHVPVEAEVAGDRER